MFVETDTLKLLLPEIVLVLMAAWIFVGSAFSPSRYGWSIMALFAYAVAAFAMHSQDLSLWEEFFGQGIALGESGPLTVDLLGHLLRWLAVGVGALLTFTLFRPRREELAGEMLGLVMLVVVGVMLVARANELVLLFLGLELVTIPTYILLFLGRRGLASAESTAKYFFLGIMASGMLLYGFSFLYGAAGSTSLVEIGQAFEADLFLSEASPTLKLAPLALILIFAGLGFKIAAAPFHFYAPDVYQGATHANAALLAVAPKIAGIVALARITVVAMPGTEEYAWRLAVILSILTMTIGNVCALWQKNLRRLMAYSSIAHSGYLLIGLAVALAGGVAGLSSMVFYLLVYVIGSLGVFAALSYLSSDEEDLNTIEGLEGLSKTNPLAAGSIAIFMLSLAGIPILAGFWGKLGLFISAVSLSIATDDANVSFWFIALAVVGAINAAIGAAYYLRVISAMYFQPSKKSPRAEGGWGPAVAMMVCTCLAVWFGVMPGGAMRSTRLAEQAAIPQNISAADTLSLKGANPAVLEKTDSLGQESTIEVRTASSQ